MGRVGPFRILVAATLAVPGCGGETIDRISVGHGPPANVGHDAGSDSGVAPPDPVEFERPSSGTRLTVVEPYSPDSPLLWDEEKNILCSPRLATDGTRRCLPTLGFSVLFSDSLCRLAVITPDPDPCGGSRKYYSDSDSAGQCATHVTTVYTAGSGIDTPQALYPHNAHPCSLLDRTVQPSEGPYYEAVPSDPAEWVSFTEEVVPVTDQLAVTVWMGADGSRLPHGLRLLPSKTPCDAFPRPQEPAAPRTWCVPTVRASPGDGFPTDQCTGERLAGACQQTDVIQLSPTGRQPSDLLETGALVSTVYFQNPAEGGKCMTLPPAWTSAPNASVFYQSGSPLPLERYPTLTLARQGSGRVQAQYWTSGGKNLFVDSYFDTTYGERCTPTRLSTGGTWCVPSAVAFIPGLSYNLYGDPGCTRPLALADPSLSSPYPFALVYPAGHSCTSWSQPTLTSMVEHRGSTFQISGGSCVPSESPPPLPPPPFPTAPQLYLEPGPPIDPADLLAAVPQ